MSFSTIKTAFKVVLLSGSVLTSSQIYAAQPIVSPVPVAPLSVSHDAPAAPAKKHSKGHHKHKKHHKKHKGKHSSAALSSEKQAEKTVENCKKLLAAPAPEHEGPKKTRKRKRCEDLISKEGIAITAADATPTNSTAKAPVPALPVTAAPVPALPVTAAPVPALPVAAAPVADTPAPDAGTDTPAPDAGTDTPAPEAAPTEEPTE